MAFQKVAGCDVLVKLKKGGSYVVLGGQTGASLERSAETIDTTDKTSGGYTTSIAGLKSWSVSTDGFVTIGDESFELLEQAFEDRIPVELEIRVGANDNAKGITYVGSAYITDFPLDFAQDSAVTYSLSFSGASALTKTVGTVTLAVK